MSEPLLTLPAPSLTNTALLFLSLITLLPVLHILYNVSPMHPISAYPGPRLWSATRLPWMISLHQGTLHLELARLHAQYGPIIRIAPSELSYTAAPAWRDIYGQVFERNQTWFKRLRASDPWTIMGAHEADHARYRRAFMAGFTDKALKDHSNLLEQLVELFISKLAETGTGADAAAVDMVAWFNLLTFDISGSLSFGESFQSVDAGKAHPWVEISCHFGKGVALMASLNFLGLNTIVAPLLKYIMPAAVRQRMVYHRQLTAEKVQQRQQRGSQGLTDFVDVVQRYNASVDEEEGAALQVTQQELEANMSIMVFAGSETVSSALAAILRPLLQHPAVLEKLTEEIRSSFATMEDIVVASVGQLEYLTAVINEGLRLGPPVAIGVPRVVPKGGASICGRHVAGGTYVAVNQYPAYRSASNFPDPEQFIPERFLKGPDQGDEEVSVFQPFQIGRHQCIGQRLAWAELRLILARLLYAFDITLAEPRQVKDWGEQKTFVFWEKEALWVRLRPH